MHSPSRRRHPIFDFRARVGAAAAALLSIAAALAWQDPSRADGVSDTVVVLGMEENVHSFSGDEENLGFRLAFQAANDRGAIHGRRIEWRAYSRPAGAATHAQVANFRRLIEVDRVFALVNFAAGDASGELLGISRDARVPYLFPHTALVSSAGERYLFTSFPSFQGEALIMSRYLARERGARRIAIAHDPNAYGRLFVDQMTTHAARFGYAVVGAAPIETREPADLSAPMRALVEANPDTIVMALYPAQARALMSAKAAQAWPGRMVSAGPLTDEQYLNVPGGTAEGTLGFCYYPDPAIGGEPGVVAYREAMGRYHTGRGFNRYSLYGYVYGQLIVEGLRRAGRGLTRETFVDAMETIAGWDAGGVMPDVTLSSTSHHAQPAGFICELQNGRFVRLSGWLAP